MFLSELLQKLSFGPLSDLSMGGEGSGTIPPAQLPKLMVRVGQSLTAMYTRFPLQVRTLVLEAVDGTYTYTLQQRFAQTSGSTEPVKYIKDTVSEPFLGDLLMIEHVYDADHCELPLNDRQNPLSLRTNSYDSLVLPAPITGDQYYIEYRAGHAQLPLVPADPAILEIRIPAHLESALMAHIAGNVYGSINSQQAMAKSQEQFTRYEAECALIEDRNTVTQSEAVTNLKPALRGWP